MATVSTRHDITKTMSTSVQSRALAPRSAFKRLLEEAGSVDQVGIEERVAKFATRSIKKKSKLWGLTTAVSMVDLTTLEGKTRRAKCDHCARRHVILVTIQMFRRLQRFAFIHFS